jgi:hypothetical protein
LLRGDAPTLHRSLRRPLCRTCRSPRKLSSSRSPPRLSCAPIPPSHICLRADRTSRLASQERCNLIQRKLPFCFAALPNNATDNREERYR